MKARMGVTLGGVALMAGGAVVCRPAVEHVYPMLVGAAHALTLSTTAPAISADTAALTRAYNALRGDTALGQAPVPEGAGAALLGLLVAASAIGGGIGQRRARHEVEHEARKSLVRSAAKDRIDPEKQQERALVARREAERQRILTKEGWYTPNAGGWYLGIEKVSGKALYLPRKIQAEHPLVNGGTGSGKSLRILVPWILGEALLKIALRASLIVIDPKDGGEITDKTIAVMRRAGFRVWVYDPYAVGSVRFNAASIYEDPEGVEAMVEAWVRSMGDFHSYFGPMTVALVAGVLLYLRDVEKATPGGDWRRVSMADVAAWNRTHETIETAEIIVTHVAAQRDAGQSDPTIEGLARQMTELIGSKGAASNVMGGVTLRLKCLNNPRVAASMAGNDIDWEEFVRVPTILYMAIDLGTARTISPVIVTGLTATKDALSQVAARHGGRLPRPVRSLTDEAVNIGKIDGLPTIVSTARSIDYGLGFATQGPKDIKREYGTQGDRVMTSLLTHIVLAQSNDDDLEHYTDAQAGVKLDDLKERDGAYIRRAGLRPTYVQTRLWFRDKRLVALVKAAGAYTKADALREQLAIQQVGMNHVNVSPRLEAGDFQKPYLFRHIDTGDGPRGGTKTGTSPATRRCTAPSDTTPTPSRSPRGGFSPTSYLHHSAQRVVDAPRPSAQPGPPHVEDLCLLRNDTSILPQAESMVSANGPDSDSSPRLKPGKSSEQFVEVDAPLDQITPKAGEARRQARRPIDITISESEREKGSGDVDDRNEVVWGEGELVEAHALVWD